MALKRKNKVAILKYKLLFEESQQAHQECNDGATDLANHLAYFQKKLLAKPVQTKQFNNMFFGIPDNNNIELSELTSNIVSKKSNNSPPTWAKQLYKKIVFITHPDKLSNINIQEIVERLTNFYLLAVESYEQGRYHDLIMIAFDLDISIDDSVVEDKIEPAIKTTSAEINNIKRMIGWAWYRVPEKEKRKTLKEHLIRLGFEFTEDEVDNAIKKARQKNKRKAGQRPVKSGRIKLK